MDFAKDTETKHDVGCENITCSLTEQIPLIEKLSDLYRPVLYDGAKIFQEVKIRNRYRRFLAIPIDSWSN
jgi:hypothetical protein